MDEKRNPHPAEEDTALVKAQEELSEAEQELEETEKLARRIKRREKGVHQYQTFIIRLLFLLLILWVLFFVVIGLTQMPTGDMSPRIDSGDMLLFYRLDRTPKAQDIIIYEKTDSEGEIAILVSRVVAVEGDTVEFTENGTLIVNGNAVSEPNIYYTGTQYIGDSAPTYPLVLGEGECFVLGDRRDQAYDSRAFGPVTKDDIIGTVINVLRRNNL